MATGSGDKVCASCGRRIAPRRRWSSRPGAWEAVRRCSAECRGRRADPRLEAAILALLAERPRRASICPSEAARRVDPAGWRALLEPARAAARRLAAQGRLEIARGGRALDPSRARGPIRLRLRGPG